MWRVVGMTVTYLILFITVNREKLFTKRKYFNFPVLFWIVEFLPRTGTMNHTMQHQFYRKKIRGRRHQMIFVKTFLSCKFRISPLWNITSFLCLYTNCLFSCYCYLLVLSFLTQRDNCTAEITKPSAWHLLNRKSSAFPANCLWRTQSSTSFLVSGVVYFTCYYRITCRFLLFQRMFGALAKQHPHTILDLSRPLLLLLW